jgi:hypothetical protein
LVFSAGALNREMVLNWTKSSGATGYKVYRSTTSPVTTGDTLVATLGDVATYTDTSISFVDSQIYYYAVLATNDGGSSSLSNEASDIWYNFSSFNLYRDEAAFASTQHAVGLSGTTYEDTINLEEGKTYYYRMKSMDSNGDLTAYSNEVYDTFLTVPSAVSDVTASAGAIGIPTLTSATYDDSDSIDLVFAEGTKNQKIDLAWTKSANATGYKIYRDTTPTATTLLNTVSDVEVYEDATVEDGQIYYYRIKATNAVGDSGYSNEDSDTWYDIDHYDITRNTESPAESGSIIENDYSSAATTYEDTTIAIVDGNEYFYKIRSVDSNGSVTDWSEEKSDIVTIAIPDALIVTLTVVGDAVSVEKAKNDRKCFHTVMDAIIASGNQQGSLTRIYDRMWNSYDDVPSGTAPTNMRIGDWIYHEPTNAVYVYTDTNTYTKING